MFPVPLVTSAEVISAENFWKSIYIYHDRPNLINRKLLGTTQSSCYRISIDRSKFTRISNIFRREALLYEIRKSSVLDISTNFLENVLEGQDVSITSCNLDDFRSSFDGIFVSIRILLARHKVNKCLELVVFDKPERTATFFAVQEADVPKMAPFYPYHLELTSSGNFRIVLDDIEDADTSSAEWLEGKLFDKLVKWTEPSDPNQPTGQSLSLVSANKYCELYNDLKVKYAEDLVKVWPSKANTDPKKFVYEDLAIAAYLICLWQELGSEDVSFVDCGCGNGLLVYVLNREGYKGCGLDLRRRKIWDVFSEHADLRVEEVTSESLFPDYTWIIGNHSDELTPWIPVIALRSSLRTNYFVLPCCSYDFSGQKYIRINTKLSQYGDYLDYVQTVSNKCGFKTKVDKLRIPSTKRICLVGTREIFDENLIKKITRDIDEFIKSRLNSGFVVRNSQETVRNCTKLDRELIKRLVNFIISEILIVENFCCKNSKGESWNKGGAITLGDLSRRVPTEDLKSLKKECGGLQTLIRNHKYLFETSNGTVSLREPMKLDESTKKYKTKVCWFYQNHPNGCLFTSETCAYKH